jgi:hypothetical protein
LNARLLRALRSRSGVPASSVTVKVIVGCSPAAWLHGFDVHMQPLQLRRALRHDVRPGTLMSNLALRRGVAGAALAVGIRAGRVVRARRPGLGRLE